MPPTRPRSVALLGTGLMGRGMLASLVRAGHAVRAWNRTRARAEEAVQNAGGGVVTDTPAAAVRDAEVAITMLADPQALADVLEGPGGVLAAVRPGTVVIDSSTVSPAAVLDAGRKLAARGAALLDAPVFGSKHEAERGDLGFMIGGDRAVFESVQDLFEGCLARSARYVGPQGSGSYAKLVVNLVIALEVEAFAEGMTLAAAAGLAPEAMYEILMASRARAGIFEMKGPPILRGDFAPFFPLKLMDKDVRLALETAQAAGVPTPALAAARQVFAACLAAGQAEEDFSSLIRHHERAAGVAVRGRG